MDVAVLESMEVLRYGLEAMLRRLDRIGRLECHSSMEELLLITSKEGDGEWKPDVTIIRCCAPDDISSYVRMTFPASRVLELVTRSDPAHVAMAARVQADGYLMVHDITEATLDVTLQALMRGELPIPVPVASCLLERARSRETSPSTHRPYFSPRERDVISLLLKGLSNQQIASKLGISVHSAKRHVSAVLNKVNSPSRVHFVAQTLRDDWAPADGL